MPKQILTSTGNALPVRDFKLNNIAQNASIVMIAKRGSGKSWCVRSILQHFKDIPVGIIIAPTDKMSNFYGTFFPESFIYYDFNTEIISKILDRQDRIIDKNKELAKYKKKIDPRAFVVMDDCLAQKSQWAKDDKIKELLMNGRHYKLMYILTMQFPLGISPELRSQFDYIFLLKEEFNSNLKRIYDHYAGMFPTFESFRQIFNQLTSNYGCMVIANTDRGLDKGNEENGFLNKIFWFQADKAEKTIMGCKQFNKYHTSNFCKDWKSKTKRININDYCMLKKKEGSHIKIERIDDD